TSMWVETSMLRARGRQPFYTRLNEILDKARFDTYGERICRKYYVKTIGPPSLAPECGGRMADARATCLGWSRTCPNPKRGRQSAELFRPKMLSARRTGSGG